MPVLQVCDGLCLNDLDNWILLGFGYLILDFLHFRCKKIKCIYSDRIRFAHFSDHYKMASPIKLLQNEGARPPIEALFSEARTHLSLHLDARVIL